MQHCSLLRPVGREPSGQKKHLPYLHVTLQVLQELETTQCMLRIKCYSLQNQCKSMCKHFEFSDSKFNSGVEYGWILLCLLLCLVADPYSLDCKARTLCSPTFYRNSAYIYCMHRTLQNFFICLCKRGRIKLRKCHVVDLKFLLLYKFPGGNRRFSWYSQ